MIGIYKITNLINGKVYIGQSIHIEKRWQEHRKPSAHSLIGKAIQKYGIANFSFEVLEELQMSSTISEELNDLEAKYISEFNSITPYGYNVLELSETVRSNYALLGKDTYEKIVDLLQHSTLTFEQIASQFGLNRRTINRINNGYSHKDNTLSYPLRTVKTNFLPEFDNCIDCGAQITYGAKRCVECSQIAQRTVTRPSREELKALIRTENFASLGRKFGVSDNTIRKWCQKENLPYRIKDIRNYSEEEWKLL